MSVENFEIYSPQMLIRAPPRATFRNFNFQSKGELEKVKS